MPILQGGGAGSHPPPNRVIRKRRVNLTLAMGHQADPAHCKKFPHGHSTPNTHCTILLFWLGKTNIARINSLLNNNNIWMWACWFCYVQGNFMALSVLECRFQLLVFRHRLDPPQSCSVVSWYEDILSLSNITEFSLSCVLFLHELRTKIQQRLIGVKSGISW